MRCEEVRRKLAKLSSEEGLRVWGEDVREHIANCEACAHQVHAQAELSRALRDASDPDFTETLSFGAVQSLVESRVAQNANENKWSTIMLRIARSFGQPAYILPAAVLVIAVLALTLTPWKVDAPGGYHVAFAGVDKDLALQEFGVQRVLVRLGISDANVEVGDCETTCNLTITDLQSEAEVGKVLSAMYKLSDCELLEVVREGDVNLYIPDQKSITFDENGNITFEFIHQLSEEDSVMVDIVVREVRFGDGADNEWVSDEDFSIRVVELVNCSIPCNPVQNIKGWSDEAVARGDTMKLTFDVCGGVALHEIGENELHFGEETPNPQTEPFAKTEASSGPISGYLLNQNYPNPFNASTTITVTVPEGGGAVTLEVYNIRGQLVKSLVDRRVEAGTHQFTWDATDSQGNEVASGVYLYRMTSGTYIETKKMSLLR